MLIKYLILDKANLSRPKNEKEKKKRLQMPKVVRAKKNLCCMDSSLFKNNYSGQELEDELV